MFEPCLLYPQKRTSETSLRAQQFRQLGNIRRNPPRCLMRRNASERGNPG
jgi:hypothetical protein